MQKMAMFTSDGTSVVLGKNDGAAALLCRDIPHSVNSAVWHTERIFGLMMPVSTSH